MNNLPEISIRLSFYFNENLHDIISKFLTLNPTKIWFKGKPSFHNSSIINKNSGWVLEKRWQKSLNLEECMIEFLQIISPKRDQIAKLSRKSDMLETELSVTLYIDNISPSINFNKEILKELSSFSVTFDLDIILV